MLILLTAVALIAFAANSILCRLALASGSIDPISFTSIRLLSGALALLVIFTFTKKHEHCKSPQGSWSSGIKLFIYALCFSIAYISLSSGTGALILFGSVQITMLLIAIKSGEQLQSKQWLGFIIAIIGLVYLLSPGIAAPNWQSALVMILSGIAWGLYTLAGKKVTAPIAMTTGNFIRAAIITIPASGIALLASSNFHFSTIGLGLALTSGIITSALGYVIWYKVLPSLSTTQSAVLQLLVPLLASLGGVIFLSESFTHRLAFSSLLILGGITCCIFSKKPQSPPLEKVS